jgi:hypothetical protein
VIHRSNSIAKRLEMNKMKIAVLSTCLTVFAGGVLAQNDAARRAEELQRSSEMMKPQTNAPAGAMNKGDSSMSTPTSEADRKADEMRRSIEMMKPPTQAPAASATTGGTVSNPASEADRKADEDRQRVEQMKPR